jgi:hypothetical protein
MREPDTLVIGDPNPVTVRPSLQHVIPDPDKLCFISKLSSI